MKISPETKAQVKQWMDECDAGLHPLSEAGKKSLEKSRGRLMDRLEAMLNRQWQMSFAE